MQPHYDRYGHQCGRNLNLAIGFCFVPTPQREKLTFDFIKLKTLKLVEHRAGVGEKARAQHILPFKTFEFKG
jgi:hypothetical protein